MVARMCKVLNVPLWVDYDDLYSAFPNWTQAQQQFYGGAEAQSVVRLCLELANVVTVSTEALKSLSQKAELVPNALPTYFWPMTGGPRSNSITWRGSSGHNADCDWGLDAMREVASTRPEHKWHFFGVPSYHCYDFGQVHAYKDAFSYMHDFCTLAPKVHVVPLVDCEFNRAKSNNAWLEATAAGAVVVAPAWPEWIRPGVINYSDLASFRDGILRALDMSNADRAELVHKSRQFITEHLTLDVVNRRRMEILRRFA